MSAAAGIGIGIGWIFVALLAAGVICRAIRIAEARRTAAEWRVPDDVAGLERELLP